MTRILLLIAFFAFFHASFAQTTITRISGCSDVGNQTIDCPRSVTLFIYGEHFFQSNSSSLKDYYIRLNQSTSSILYPPTTVNDTCITLSFQVYYGQFMNSDLIDVVITYQWVEIARMSGFSFIQTAPELSLSHIEGCPIIRERLNGLKCDFNSAITLIGAGFLLLGNENYQLNYGSESLLFQPSQQVLNIINDSMITMNLSATTMLMPLEAYSSPVSIQIIGNLWNMTGITLSYLSIPSVQITDIFPLNDQGCLAEKIAGKIRLNGCYAGRSIVRIQGLYFWPDTQIYIGGNLALPGAAQRYYSDVLDIFVPIFDSEPGVFYDIRIVNAVTDMVLSNAISMVSTAEIAAMTACVRKQNIMGVSPAWKAFCLEGESFTFTTVNLRGRSAPRVWFGPYECPNARILNDQHTVQCDVPADPDGTASVAQGLYLSWPDRNSSQIMFELWDHPYAPRVSQLVGDNCYQSANLSKPMQCLFDPSSEGRNLTITTSRLPMLPANKYWTVNMYYKQGSYIGSSRFPRPSIDSAGTVTLWMPGTFRGALTDEAVYQVTVAANDLSDDSGSNVLPLLLVGQITYDPVDASSSSDHALAITLGVLLPVAFVAVAVAVYVYRKHRSSKLDAMVSSDHIDSEVRRRIELA